MTLKSRTLTPVTQLFIDCAREVVKPLANKNRAIDSVTPITSNGRHSGRTERKRRAPK